MDDGWVHDDEDSYYKVIKDYDKNDFLGASVIHDLLWCAGLRNDLRLFWGKGCGTLFIGIVPLSK